MGDQIYGFGFSRGAFTIRVLTGLILSQGLVTGTTDAELHANARLAYRAYRKVNFKSRIRFEVPLRMARDGLIRLFGGIIDAPKKAKPEDIRITFLGLWDTVAAYGTPIDEMTRGIGKWIWPLELPNRHFDHERIERACHALAVDDERTTFHPVLWNEFGVPDGQLKQVWFSGVHSNIGGGYPDDSLAYIPLYWIVEEAKKTGLAFKAAPDTSNANRLTAARLRSSQKPYLQDRLAAARQLVASSLQGGSTALPFDPDFVVHARTSRDQDGRLYDSRNGLGGYYRYGPRKIADLIDARFSNDPNDYVKIERAKIHESVIARARSGAHAYAPIGLPAHYDVISDEGPKDQSAVEPEENRLARCTAQERVWNLVWRRRVVYFLTVFTSIYLALYPLARSPAPSEEFSTRLSLVSDLIRLVGKVLPGFVQPWIDAYARDPSHFLIVGSLVAFLIWLGTHVGAQIQSRMQSVWRPDSSVQSSGALWNIIFGAACMIAAAGVLYPWADRINLLTHSQIEALQIYITTWVRLVLIALLLTFLLSETAIQELRLAKAYQNTIQFFKLEVAPGLIALMLVLGVLMLVSHVAFNVQESMGVVCEESSDIATFRGQNRLGKVANDYGLGSCLTTGVASCSGSVAVCSGGRQVQCARGQPTCRAGGVPMCSERVSTDRFSFVDSAGPAMCPAVCEEHTLQFDVRSVCTATKLWLEEGQRYSIKVVPNEVAWMDDKKATSARGYYLTDINDPWDRFVSILLWPLKRGYFAPNFRVVARIGSTGNNEEFLIPDPIPDEKRKATLKIDDVTLDEVIRPKSSGELFLYVNDTVLAGPKSLRGQFYEANRGTAKVIVKRALR